MVYGKLGKFDDALDDLSNALKIDSSYADAFFNRGITYFKLKKNYEAISDYLNACKFDSSFCINSYDNIGYCYFEMMDYSNALKNFIYCLEKDSSKFDSMIGLSMTYYNLKKFDKSKFWMNKAIDLEPRMKKGKVGIDEIAKNGYSYSNEKITLLKKIFELMNLKW